MFKFVILTLILLSGCTSLHNSNEAGLKLECSECKLLYYRDKVLLDKQLEIKGI